MKPESLRADSAREKSSAEVAAWTAIQSLLTRKRGTAGAFASSGSVGLETAWGICFNSRILKALCALCNIEYRRGTRLGPARLLPERLRNGPKRFRPGVWPRT